MAVSLLRELHTAACLWQLQVNLWDKSVKLSFCPFCAYAGRNDLSYLNHIIIAHYNASYRCGRCLKQAFVSSSALHTHKKVCLRFSRRPLGLWTANPRVVEAAVATGVLPKPPQEGQQGDCHQLPGLKCPLGLSDFTIPQQTGDLPPPQVQEG